MYKELLKRQIDYVLSHSEFYKRKLKTFIVNSSKSIDIRRLPFTTKEELLTDQGKYPPFGSNLCIGTDSIRRIHKTSGTTDKPLLIALSKNDIEETVKIGKKCFVSSGLKPTDIVVHCLSYNMWMGGYTDHQSLEATGAAVIPYGVGNTKALIDTILDIKPTCIHCTPSYLAKIELVLISEHKKSPIDLGLEVGLFGAESGLQNPAFRKVIEEKWGIKAMNANYGMADVLSMFGAECSEQNGLHFMGDGVLFPELINSETLESIPIVNGAVGELVVTNLKKEAQPLIRYRTSDVIKILSTDMCSCGFSGFKFEIIGRSDDMFIVKGVNVFVNAVSKIVHSYLNVLSGDFQIHVNANQPNDKVLLILERHNRAISASWKNDLRENIFETCKTKLNISPEIMLLDFGKLPKTDGKSKRLFRTL